MKKIRRRRASGRGIGAGILPAGLLKQAGYTGAGFIGFGYLFNFLAERFPQLANPNSPWMRIGAKAISAVLAGFIIRKYANREIGTAVGVGGLMTALLDAWVQFQASQQAGLGNMDTAQQITAAPTGMYLPENSQAAAAAASNRMLRVPA